MDARLAWARLRRAVRRHLLPALRHVGQSRVTRCPCCERLTVILAVDPPFRVCVRCRAAPRYWMLAACVRELRLPSDARVLELDGRSPLRFMLQRRFGEYTRSFFDPAVALGSVREDGAICEDISQLTVSQSSFDLIVSSEVLEHVPDLHAALSESERALRPGGTHLFTVPPREHTLQRARRVKDQVEHLTEAEYHSDPLSKQGILVYWDIGISDGAELLSRPGLNVRVVAGPGPGGRVVWAATTAGADRG